MAWSLLCCWAALLPADAALAGEKPPNVVFILTDNQGAWTLGCYGNEEIATPHIDRLADEGLLMTRAFASNPVCSPTRATFLTGLLPSQHGVHCFLRAGRLQTGPDARNTLEEFDSLPQVLKQHGYRCGLVGKWHLGGNLEPQEGLEDYWVTMPHGGTSTFYDAEVIEDGQIRTEPKYLTEFWTDHAVKFINQDDERPFFLYLAHNGPYALGRLLLNEPRNRHAESYAEMELSSFPRGNPHAWQFNNLDYMNNPVSLRRVAAEVSGVDDGVGRVMAALQERGLDENTLVIYSSDQGWVGGHGGFFGMGDHTRPVTACDGMMQIPMIFRHPLGLPGPRRSDLMVTNYDFMPTVLGYLGLSRRAGRRQPPGDDQIRRGVPSGDSRLPLASPGRDFSKLLRGDPVDDWENEVFYEFEFLRCIRTERWKLVKRYYEGPDELFDLDNDPLEETNLIADAEHQQIRQRLERRLEEYFNEHANPKYDLVNGGGSQTALFLPSEPPEGSPAEKGRQQGATAVPAVPARVDAPSSADSTAHRAVAPSQSPTANSQQPPFQLPDGYTIERVAGPPLVNHPMMAGFDDRGRLFVAESAGLNLRRDDLEEQLPNSIRLLEDTTGDGVFDKATTFADNMTFPQGALWYRDALYVASSPNIWRLEDTNGDGVANKREVVVSGFGYTGNAADVHGCFLGPDGRIYWCDGRHGHEFRDDEGNLVREGKGSYIFSCWPDGSDLRPHCGGGMDNPVEVDFTETGDVIGTVNILYRAPRSDALVHWLYGGTYPHSERVLGEFKKTGDLLGPIHEFGHVAVSGTMRYRSGLMDRRFRDNFFVTIFNTGKLLRCDVTPERGAEGSSYSVTQHEFLSCSDPDFHPTDVLEDADGSLLLVDTGGWFRIGCPQSVVAKPEITGGIYRIRREGMPEFIDPRGLRIDWENLEDRQLVALLGDTRHAVRERAIDECARRGERIIPLLEQTLRRRDVLHRRNAVWALTRMRSDASREAVRHAFTDRDETVRAAACHSAAVTQDEGALEELTKLLDDNSPHVRRQAMTALGRIGNADAVPPLLARADRVADREEEHALIFALIEIDRPLPVIAGLEADAPAVRRAALIALDQMDDQHLSPQMVLTAMQSGENVLIEVAAGIFSQRPEWADTVTGVLDGWFAGEFPGVPSSEISRLLTALVNTPDVAAWIGARLAGELDSTERHLILHSIAEAAQPSLNESWESPLRSLLATDDAALVQRTIAAVRKLPAETFRESLAYLVDDPARPDAIRLAALEAVTSRNSAISKAGFELAVRILEQGSAAQSVDMASRVVGQAALSPEQLRRLLPLLPTAGALELRELVRPFARSQEADILNEFAATLMQARARLSLTEKDLDELIRRWPDEAALRLAPLREELTQQHAQREQRLKNLEPFALKGRVDRGREVFFSEKAKCATCHRVGTEGGRIGPDLSGIGRIRLERDLLEAILYPSLSFAREFEPYSIATATGQVFNGLIVNETNDALFVQQQTGDPVPILKADIEVISPSTVSIMPQGLDSGLTPDEIGDLVAYLRSLRGSPSGTDVAE